MDSQLQLLGLRSHLTLNPAQFLLHPLVLLPQLFVEVARLILARVDAGRLSLGLGLVLIVEGREGPLVLLVQISVRG